MKVAKFFPLVVSTLLVLTGCASIPTPQMTYLGEATQKMEVTGKSSHLDFAGLGSTAQKYAEEYNAALDDAFQKAPVGTQVLRNIKILKAPNNYPNAFGLTLLAGGGGLIAGANVEQAYGVNTGRDQMMSSGILMVFAGTLLSGINSYDLLVFGEPSSN